MKDNLNPLIILARPQLAQNIGMCARAMKNFSVNELSLVNPREGSNVLQNQDTLRASSGADDIIENAKIYTSIFDASKDCTTVYSLSKRPRDINKQTLSLKEACKNTAKAILKGEKSAFLFGPEASGLSNEDIENSNCLISIETNEDFGSLNLSQSVMLVCYEIFQEIKAQNPLNEEKTQQSKLASQKHYNYFFKQLENKTKDIDNQDLALAKLKNIFLRSNLSIQEINLLHLLLK